MFLQCDRKKVGKFLYTQFKMNKTYLFDLVIGQKTAGQCQQLDTSKQKISVFLYPDAGFGEISCGCNGK